MEFISGANRTEPSLVYLYRISFTALGNIGHFRFRSDITGHTYALSAEAKVDATIFRYGGQTKSTGTVP